LPYVGTLTAMMTPETNSSDMYAISGQFTATPDGGQGNACAGTMSGCCCYTPPSDAGTSSGGATPTLVTAGKITVQDGSDISPTIWPWGAGTYYMEIDPWRPGDTLLFSATGDTVQAFSGTVKAPDFPIAGINPALSQDINQPTQMFVGKDFTITWTPGSGSGNTMTLYLTAYLPVTIGIGFVDGTITCWTDDSAGTLTIPWALLSHVSTNDNETIALVRAASSTVIGGNATVALSAATQSSGAALLWQQ
jgi:hypothetical protein